VLGASLGGATYGAVLAATGSAAAAGYSSAAVESFTNEAISYTPAAEYNGTYQKEVSTENVVNSMGTVIADTAVNGTTYTITGKVAEKIMPTNNNWFKPEKFVSSFTGKYAIKSQIQTGIQGVLIYGIELVKSGLDWISSLFSD